ncbi:hypothetical protein RYX36_028962 [Vicia faba]
MFSSLLIRAYQFYPFYSHMGFNRVDKHLSHGITKFSFEVLYISKKMSSDMERIRNLKLTNQRHSDAASKLLISEPEIDRLSVVEEFLLVMAMKAELRLKMKMVRDEAWNG